VRHTADTGERLSAGERTFRVSAQLPEAVVGGFTNENGGWGAISTNHFGQESAIHRRSACGDARTFQGSERDIMFLSIVADRKRYHALSGNAYDQRFNVAASRARDRMYFVRSVPPEQFSEKDIRVPMLEHFSNPMVDSVISHAGLSASRVVSRASQAFTSSENALAHIVK
jgi:hypothetical protein